MTNPTKYVIFQGEKKEDGTIPLYINPPPPTYGEKKIPYFLGNDTILAYGGSCEILYDSWKKSKDFNLEDFHKAFSGTKSVTPPEGPPIGKSVEIPPQNPDPCKLPYNVTIDNTTEAVFAEFSKTGECYNYRFRFLFTPKGSKEQFIYDPEYGVSSGG